MSNVRGRSWEDPMPKGQWPKGVTPRPRSGVAAESARLQRRRNGREKLPRAGGQGQRPGGTTLHPKNGGAVATRAQEGLEELCHMEGQEGWR